MKFRCLALSGLLAFSVPSLAGADPASDAARYVKEGNYAAAIERLRAAAPFTKEQVQERFLHATALAGMGERARAVKEFEALIADYPDNPEPYNNLAALYASEGKLEQAKEVLERAMRTDARYAAVYGNLSAIYVEMARASYAKALRLKETAPAPELRMLYAMGTSGTQREITVAAVAPALSPAKTVPETTTPESKPVTFAQAAITEQVPPSPPAPVTVATAEPTSPVVSAETAPASASSDSEAPAVEPASVKAAPVSAPPATRMAQSAPQEEVRAMLEAWAAAWSHQDVETYLSFYAPDFAPPRGMARADWEAERRARLARPGHIEVTLEDIEVRPRGADAATVRVVQGYRSNDYQDRTRKAFSVVHRDGRWLITSERTLQILP